MNDTIVSLESRKVQALEAIASELKRANDLRERQVKGEIRPDYCKPKDETIWIDCNNDLNSRLGTNPYVDWNAVRDSPIFRDTDKGNMYRKLQWRRYLEQHALPRKPDVNGPVLVELGKSTKDGPEAVTRLDGLHCAQRAHDDPESFRSHVERPDEVYFDKSESCYYCRLYLRGQKMTEAEADRAMLELFGDDWAMRVARTVSE